VLHSSRFTFAREYHTKLEVYGATNDPAYFERKLIVKVKYFMLLAPRYHSYRIYRRLYCKTFTAIIAVVS
jgi:hypothetical protein